MHLKALRASWLAIASLAFVLVASAEDFGWRDKEGNPAPDTDSRKISQGFAGWILTTSDADWQAKWNTPEHETPSFAAADKVHRGQTIYTLIFLANPKAGDDGKVDVRCDLRVTRPNGTLSIDQSDVECLKGVLQGSPNNVRLAAPVLGFVAEASDPIGTWKVDVTLRDVPRGASMDLHSSFELVAGEAPKL
jgi:hypothetical protein